MYSHSQNARQTGHMFPVFESLPCYTLQQPWRMQTASRGEYKVLPPKPGVSIANSLSFDTNWGRSDYIPILPAGVGDDDWGQTTVNDTMQRPKLSTDYRNLPYHLRSDSITTVDFLRYQSLQHLK